MVKQSFIHQSSLNGLSSEIVKSSGTCCGCTIVAYVRYAKSELLTLVTCNSATTGGLGHGAVRSGSAAGGTLVGDFTALIHQSSLN